LESGPVVEPSRAGLSGSRFEVVGRSGDPSELLALVREHRPDLVIVDIRMPPMHTTEGLDAARVIRRELPETGILILSARRGRAGDRAAGKREPKRLPAQEPHQ
jgi:DNA-binding NarL/FixJ family response regulator